MFLRRINCCTAKIYRNFVSFIWLLCSIIPGTNLSAQVSVTRLNNDQPIIYRKMPGTEGNINGPSLIRIPDWIPLSQRADSSARYYLYFSSHWGQHIKMAWSEFIDGPYTIYNPYRGVFHLDSYDKGRLTLNNHVASPDVLVDDMKRQITMYFHAGNAIWDGDTIDKQKTVVAISPDGLDFNSGLQDLVVCPFYARIFEHNDYLYALTKEGVYQAGDLYAPWSHNETFSNTNPQLWKRVSNPFRAVPNEERHFAVLLECDTLHVMYSRYPSSPEHIEYSSIQLKARELGWEAEQPIDILYPELEWEGVSYPIQESVVGWEKEVHELRDPDLFRDKDGQVYLLYTGAGENALGIARLDGLVNPQLTPCSCGSNCSDALQLFPNPVSGDHLSIAGIDKEAIISVYEPSGQNLLTKYLEGTGTYRLDLTGIPKGLKLISIQDDLGICWHKLILL